MTMLCIGLIEIHSALQDSYTMTLVVYNARRQVFVQECAYLFLIAALRQKQNIALHLLLVFLKMGSTLCCVSLGRCCLGPETRVIIKISTYPCCPINGD